MVYIFKVMVNNMSKSLKSLEVRLKDYFKNLQMSQKEVGELIGAKQTQVNKWFTGKNTPSITNIEKLCEALNCTPNELLGYKEGSERLNILPKHNEILTSLMDSFKEHQLLINENQGLHKILKQIDPRLLRALFLGSDKEKKTLQEIVDGLFDPTKETVDELLDQLLEIPKKQSDNDHNKKSG